MTSIKIKQGVIERNVLHVNPSESITNFELRKNIHQVRQALDNAQNKLNKILMKICLDYEFEYVNQIRLKQHCSYGSDVHTENHITSIGLKNTNIDKLRIVIDYVGLTRNKILAQTDVVINVPSLILVDFNQQTDSTSMLLNRKSNLFSYCIETNVDKDKIERIFFDIAIDISLINAFFGSLKTEKKKEILSKKYSFERQYRLDNDVILSDYIESDDFDAGNYSFAKSCHRSGVTFDIESYMRKWSLFASSISSGAEPIPFRERPKNIDDLMDEVMHRFGNHSGMVNKKRLKKQLSHLNKGSYYLAMEIKKSKNSKHVQTLRRQLHLKGMNDVVPISSDDLTKTRTVLPYLIFYPMVKEF